VVGSLLAERWSRPRIKDDHPVRRSVKTIIMSVVQTQR
jgi:hypothetical protein